jgi:hypothetical protein
MEGRLLSIRSGDPRRARDVLREAPGIDSAVLFGEEVHVELDAADDGVRVRSLLEEAGVEVLGIEPVEASLEDVFIRRVERSGTGGRGG